MKATAKKPAKKPAKKAARKAAYASQRAFRTFADDCTDHLALHTEQLNKLDAKRLQQYRQHELRLNDHEARLDAQHERLSDAMKSPSVEELESTVRALCKSEIMAHMQRLLGPERWKEMMSAPGVVVHATAETVATPLTPSTTASLLLAAADKIADLQSTVTAEYGEDDSDLETVRLERQLRDRAKEMKSSKLDARSVFTLPSDSACPGDIG